MAATSVFNSTIESILSEVESLSTIEQKEVLAYINARKLKRAEDLSFINPGKGIKPLTMAQIDNLKHQVRKRYASK